MTGERHPYSLPLAASLVLLAAAVRVLLLANEFYPLHGDEAQYWLWAQTPDLGYYSKPPMIAWIIGVTTAVFGDREFGVRIAAPLFHAGTALAIYGIGHRLFDRRIGFWSALTYAALPAVSLSSLIMSTDVPFLFFWAIGLYWLVRALEEDRWRWWLGMGWAIGLGLLSRYSMALFPASLALYALFADRALLVKRKAWAAMALAFLVYLPNLAWNATHSFATFKHTGDNANLQGPLFNPNKLADFLGGQFGVFGPILFALLLMLLARPLWQRADERRWLLAAFVWPMLGVACAVAFLSRANANWAASTYIAGSVLVVAWALEPRPTPRWRSGLVVAALTLHVAIAGAGYAFHDIARLAGYDLTVRRNDVTRKIKGGREIGAAVAQALRQQPPGTVLMTDERMVFALLSFYVRPRPEQVQWNPDQRIDNHFELTTSVAAHAGDPILYVTRQENPPAAAHFQSAERLGQITIPLYRDSALVYQLFALQGYKP